MKLRFCIEIVTFLSLFLSAIMFSLYVKHNEPIHIFYTVLWFGVFLYFNFQEK